MRPLQEKRSRGTLSLAGQKLPLSSVLHLLILALVHHTLAFTTSPPMTRTRMSAAAAAAGDPSDPSRLRLVTNKKCPFAQKAWIALDAYYHSNGKSIQTGNGDISGSTAIAASSGGYELLEVGLYGGNGKPGWFREISPKGQVPVLWLPSGRIIIESDVILDHLTTLPEPNPLIPPSHEAYRQWQAILVPFLKTARTAIEHGDDASLFSALSQLEEQIPTPGPFLAGATFSVADCSVLPFMQRLNDKYQEVVEKAAPSLNAWYALAQKERCFQATRVGEYWMWW